MCCFAGPVSFVANTNLFARLTDKGTQMLAYQMEFETKQENAMILPLPVATPAREDSLRFISLKQYDQFFTHLANAFPRIAPRSRRIDSLLPNAAPPEAMLEVHEVGDFVASFVPTMSDFARLDQRFVIPKSSWDKIPRYADYGFAVFQLKNLKGKPHPMAFEFDTRLKGEVFFPTVHIHDGEVHQREAFDHTLYLQNANFDQAVGEYKNSHVKEQRTGFVRSKEVAKRYLTISKTAGMVEPNLLVHRIRLQGTLENKDIITPTAAGIASVQHRPRWGRWLPYTPAALGIASLGWIFNRRNQLRARD